MAGALRTTPSPQGAEMCQEQFHGALKKEEEDSKRFCFAYFSLRRTTQAYPGDTGGRSQELAGFPVHIKGRVPLRCSIVSVEQYVYF